MAMGVNIQCIFISVVGHQIVLNLPLTSLDPLPSNRWDHPRAGKTWGAACRP